MVPKAAVRRYLLLRLAFLFAFRCAFAAFFVAFRCFLAAFLFLFCCFLLAFRDRRAPSATLMRWALTGIDHGTVKAISNVRPAIRFIWNFLLNSKLRKLMMSPVTTWTFPSRKPLKFLTGP